MCVCKVVAEENKIVALARENCAAAAAPLPLRACAVCLLPLRGERKLLHWARLWPALQVLAMQERAFYFSVSVIKLVRLYKVFSKFTVRAVIVNPCLVLPPQARALGMTDSVLTPPPHVASGLSIFLTLLQSRLIFQQRKCNCFSPCVLTGEMFGL